jgi:hypothetical protein
MKEQAVTVFSGLMHIWAAHLRNHEWAVIHDAVHAMTWEQPGRFNDIVLDFLRRHSTAQPQQIGPRSFGCFHVSNNAR